MQNSLLLCLQDVIRHVLHAQTPPAAPVQHAILDGCCMKDTLGVTAMTATCQATPALYRTHTAAHRTLCATGATSHAQPAVAGAQATV